MFPPSELIMVSLPPIPRSQIDQWPVAVSGLSPRAANCLARAHIQNVGELRRISSSELLNIRTLGKVSLRDIRSFLNKTKDLEQGISELPSIKSLIQQFVDRNDRTVLEQRFGLLGSPMSPEIERMSLQAIGEQYGRTRERIRQCEQSAMDRLRTRLATHLLRPYAEKLIATIDSRDKILSAEEALILSADPDFQDYHPGGLLLLFSAIFHSICYHNHFFSTIPQKTLLNLEKELLGILSRQSHPVSSTYLAGQLAQSNPDIIRSCNFAHPEQGIERILIRDPDVEATIHMEFFTHPEILINLISDAISRLGDSAHYRDITRQYNEFIHPTRHLGVGSILKILNGDDRFVRVERAHYALVHAHK
jgi:hypothetical protein